MFFTREMKRELIKEFFEQMRVSITTAVEESSSGHVVTIQIIVEDLNSYGPNLFERDVTLTIPYKGPSWTKENGNDQ